MDVSLIAQGFGISALYILGGDTREIEEIQAGNIKSKGPSSGDMYVTGRYVPINKNTFEISQADDEVYNDMPTLAEELPDHSPRYVLLSYPLTLASGRLSVPYVLIYYLPATCNAELRMLYAGAKELMRSTAEVGRAIELQDLEDLESIEEKLGAEQ
ncbi:uncharacterized protein KY384_007774 [Bacidia gigantensis]|uniref:uncharacterized protein n=1 Tax=Bacidia gigantensis TaxID=2732470 RepID=UPI001D05B240|nr:uncharacterized protein KY384_007774 [Bacidia gigantensis]KAG8527621.1 hypothetical protein KY384_007774 [Bacidia gigantensis]